MTYQTWAVAYSHPDHHTGVTHAAVSEPNEVPTKTLCGRLIYGYLESDLSRYGIQCRACQRNLKKEN